MTPTPYFYPESYGLWPVGEIHWHSEPHEFFITAVWLDDEGTVYWGTDIGCSCPIPFEYFELRDLSRGSPVDLLQFFIRYKGEHPDIVSNDRTEHQIMDVLERLGKEV